MDVHNDDRVDKYIRSLPRKDSAQIVRVVDLFKDHGFSLTSLYLKKLTAGLWELRTGRWRLLFGVVQKKAIIVHVFFKKTQKTPKNDIQKALHRLEEYRKYET